MSLKKIWLRCIVVFLITSSNMFSSIIAVGITGEKFEETTETNTVTYTKQPTSLAEVQLLIDNYNKALANAITDEELSNINLPRFEFEIESELIPEGYYCKYIKDDENFNASYYTLDIKTSIFSNGIWGGGDGSSEEQAYLIEDAKDLMILADTVSTTQHYTGKYFKVTNNIDISEYDWDEIGSSTTSYFGGNFDGQEYAIQGLNGTKSTSYYGFFGYVSGATIKNLNIEMLASTTFKAGSQLGCLVGRIGCSSVHKETIIDNCNVNGNHAAIAGTNSVGGLVGAINSNGTNNSAHRVYITNCTVKNLTFIGNGVNVGGVVGATYQATFNNTTVENARVSGYSYVGGFAGIIYGGNNYQSEIINCSTKGNGVVYTSYDYLGGFAGAIYGYSKIKNSFSQFDVSSSYNNMVAGGFAGIIYDYANVTNCYSIGSISKNNTASGGYLGGFSGKIHGYAKVNNSYATGSLIYNSSNVRLGGFASELATSTTVSNCYYDTTTSRQSSAVGNTTNHTIIGLSTKEMILQNKYTFSLTDNTNGKANASGSDDNPWYIDDNMTYPYLYYQYDNLSYEEVNYKLEGLLYGDDSAIGQRRADFTINSTNLPIKVKSAGAARAYFPYAGTSLYDINTSTYTNILGAENNNNLWSLGSVSKTGIIAFDGVPYAEKTSNRDSLHTYGKTYVGDTITYTITLYNYSSEADYIKPIIIENIPNGLTLITDSISLKIGNSINNEVLNLDNTLPYYSYDGTDLTIYLNDLLKSGDNGLSYYTITFDVYVEKEAASIFHGDGSYTGDIQNNGIVTGDLRYANDEDIFYEISFDDQNTDPVYNVFVLKILKTDLENKPLEGAIFSLYIWNGMNNVVPPDSQKLVTSNNIVTDTSSEGWYLYKEDLISGDDGYVDEVQLFNYPNYYQLVETTAPVGYILPRQQWRLYLNNDAISLTVSNILDTTNEESIELTELTNSKGTYYQLINKSEEILGSITIEEYNQDNSSSLVEAIFLIEKEINGEYVYISWDDENKEWIENNQTGFIQNTTLNNNENIASTVFSNLAVGKYRITETSSSSNIHMPLLDSLVVDIPTINDKDEPIYDVTFTIYNNQLLELPEAGNQFNKWQVMFIGLLIVLCTGALYYKVSIECRLKKKWKNMCK